MSTLHYFYDPFCGWCYGAAPIISVADSIDELTIKPHGIGMLSGSKSKMMSPEWRDFVRPHETRIHALSGQEFGEAYTAGLQERQDVLLDSSRPIAAMLTAQALSGDGIPMLKRLQKGYYVEGKVITDPDVIADLAEELGFEKQVFIKQYQKMLADGVDAHIQESHLGMAEAGKQGVPAFILEHNGKYHELPFGHFISRPEKITEAIRAIIEN
jgi:Predicted protein-disulfide isomerase